MLQKRRRVLGLLRSWCFKFPFPLMKHVLRHICEKEKRASQQGVKLKLILTCHTNRLCNKFKMNIIVFISNRIDIYNKECVFLMTWDYRGTETYMDDVTTPLTFDNYTCKTDILFPSSLWWFDTLRSLWKTRGWNKIISMTCEDLITWHF